LDLEIRDGFVGAVGNTPLIRLRGASQLTGCNILGKAEFLNPGGSVKDRAALYIILDAEKRGALKPGGVIVEGTAGNTGIGLALVGNARGYRTVIVIPDTQSREKKELLRLCGAELREVPAVPYKDPNNYVHVSERLAKELGAFWANQWDNTANRDGHYRSTGPEIWEQTDGRVTHLVVGVGTGGTASGAGRYLKERNPNIKVWGIDTYGSVFKKYKETGIFDKNEIYPYITEGIGEDFLPQNVDFKVIDHFEKVTDKDAAIMTRRIAREEGIFAGNSAGSAMAGLLQLKDRFTEKDVIVVIFHDHGSRYLGKMYNDDWMRRKGFIETHGMAASELVASGFSGELFSVESNEPVEHAIRVMSEHDFSQISITRDKRLIGSLNEAHLYAELVKNPDVKQQPVEVIMQPAFPFADASTPVQVLSSMITAERPAVLVRDFKTDKTFIITRSDLIRVL